MSQEKGKGVHTKHEKKTLTGLCMVPRREKRN